MEMKDELSFEIKKNAIWGFVSVVAIVVIGFLLFTGCQQEHQYNMECIKRGGFMMNRQCIYANPN